MFRISLGLITVLFLFSCLNISRAQDSFSDIDSRNFTELAEDNAGTTRRLDQVINNSDLVFYDDPLTFNQSCSDLAIEDFEDTNVEPDSDLACAGPFNSSTDNDCYSEGALVEGFTLTASGNEFSELIVITPPLFTLLDVAVGPDELTENTRIDFNPTETGAGLFIVTPQSSGVLTVEVYGPDDALLGSADLNMEENNSGTFLGVTAPGGISKIVLNNKGQSIGELLYELQFGDCGLTLGSSETIVPTLSGLGLIAMAGILGLAGFIFLRNRKLTAA
jgi:hypothetical protein